ncbi:MAG: DUF5856 family protein [Chitinophagaceae bacterium]
MIEELVSRVFATRNAVHLAHWAESSGFRHVVLGEFYDRLIDKVDAVVEAHQGAYGLIGDVKQKTVDPDDVAEHIGEEAKWIDQNRDKIAGNIRAISNLVDDLVDEYLSTHYKLTKLS